MKPNFHSVSVTGVVTLLIVSFGLHPAEVPSFFGILPGSTTRAEVELLLGEPAASPAGKAQAFEYQAPADAVDAAKVVVGYFQDTREVSRLDVYLKTPLAAESLRAEFGRRSLVQDREDGYKEEFYYPRYQGLILRSGETGESAVAIVFLSPRYLSDMFLARFNLSLGKKDYEQARLEAEKAKLSDPENAEVYVAQGRYFYALKDFDQALVFFARALNAKYSPSSKAKAHTWIGFVHWHHKNSQETAAKEFKEAIATWADYPAAHFQLGSLLFAQGDKEQGAAEFVKTLAIDPTHTQARMRLADYFYDRKEHEKALEHYEILSAWAEGGASAEAETTVKAVLHFRYGVCLLDGINELAPDYEKPIAAFKKAIALDSQQEMFYANLGYACEQKEDLAEAEKAYQKSVSLKPDSVFNNRHLGLVQVEQGRAQEALAQAHKTQSLAPQDPVLMIDIARCYAALKKKGEAKDWIKKAVQTGYSDPHGNLLFDPFFPEVFTDKELSKLLERKS